MEYLLHIGELVCILAVLAIALDIVTGHMGFVSVSHAAFYGIGAYCSALLAVLCGAGFVVALLIGVFLSFLMSFFVSLPSLRLHDDFFVIATFGFQMILFNVFNNWIELTRGPLGIYGILPPVIFGWHVTTNLDFLILSLLFVAFAFFVVNRIASSPFGRVLHAIRENEVTVGALAKNARRYKVSAFAVSAMLAAMAGSLYAHYITYIDPTSFTINESILVLSMVIIGGAGSKWGPLLGAVVLVTLPEALRFVGMPSAIAANMRQIIYGLALVACMLWRPQGLIGEYTFGREGERK